LLLPVKLQAATTMDEVLTIHTKLLLPVKLQATTT